ncbi:MAG: PRC-barrel domain-containing protein [Candidatus Hodarchaeota archaeon]
MSMYSKLRDVRVRSTDEESLGRVIDLIIRKKNGEIIALVIEPDKDIELEEKLPRDDSDNIILPFSAAELMGNEIVIDMKKLRVLLMKQELRKKTE